jgi:hypothetical protein
MLWALLLAFAIACDHLTTGYAVRRWGANGETNPLFRPLYERGRGGTALLVQVVLAYGGFALTWLFAPDALWVVPLIIGLAVVNNLWQIALGLRRERRHIVRG